MDDVRYGRMAPTLSVSDIPRAVSLYTNVLGFKCTFENGDPVGFVILRKDDAEVHLTRQRDHAPPKHNVAHLLVDDVDRLHAICQRAGLRIVKGLRDQEYGLRSFVVEDIDGNRIDIGQII